MIVPDDRPKSNPAPYAGAAMAYYRLGWAPVPVRGKSPPERGFTGTNARDASEREIVERVGGTRHGDNIGLRLPDTVVGIDVDVHDGKCGDKTLARAVSALGELPSTISSTARGPDGPARIYFYRVPADLADATWEQKLRRRYGPDIDIIRRGHRYAMAAPSVHPDTGTPYHWYAPDGREVEYPPRPAELPMLPGPWIDFLADATVGHFDGGRRAYQDLIDGTVGEGGRHGALVSLAAKLRYDGAGQDAILGALVAANAKLARPKPQDEIEQIAEWAAGRSAGNGHETPSYLEPTDYEDQDEDTDAGVHYDDVGNSERLIRDHGEDLRHAAGVGWHVWDGTRWRRDTMGRVYRAAKRVAAELRADADHIAVTPNADETAKDAAGRLADLQKRARAHAKYSASAYGIEAAVKLARLGTPLSIEAEDLDQAAMKLNVLNGTVDLRTGLIGEARREDLITKLAPVYHEPGARSTVWDAFLERILPDPEVRACVQRLCGYAATGRATEDVLPILYGTGANGKSTFLEVVSAVLGEYALSINSSVLVASRHEQHSTEMAQLQGARLVTCQEIPAGARLDEAKTKQLTGGDAVRAHFMRQDNITIKPSWLIVWAVNHRPVIEGTDYAIWRRLLLIPFTVTIPEVEQDRDLQDKLTTDHAPAILAWLIDGALEWQRIGIAAPGAVKAATTAYRGDMDALGEFLAECCVVDAGGSVALKELYGKYSEWCDSGVREALAKNRFSAALTERGFPSDRPDHGKLRNLRVRRGLRLREEGETAADAAPDATHCDTVSLLSPQGMKINLYQEDTASVSQCVALSNSVPGPHARDQTVAPMTDRDRGACSVCGAPAAETRFAPGPVARMVLCGPRCHEQDLRNDGYDESAIAAELRVWEDDHAS